MKLFFIFIQSALLFHYLLNGVEAIECDVEPKNNEGRLRKKLFCNYDKTNRPITTNGAIVIKIKMIVKGFAYDDLQGKLTVSTWLAMTWKDEHLTWNPRDFNNVTSITQSKEDIWYPDLSLYNSDVASAQEEACKSANCVINSSGMVSCIPPCSHTAKCTPNYTRWPFDRQNCTLHFGTWVNSGEEFDFNVLKTIITEDELSSQNLEWNLIRAAYKRNPGNFTDTKQTYPSLTFSFLIERHSASHAAGIIVPSLILVLLNLISLWVDSENNRRIILLSLSLYGHFVYMQSLYFSLPHNGDTVPDLLKFFCDSLFITGSLIITTIVCQGLSSCSTPIPAWVDKTTEYISKNRAGHYFLTQHLVTKSQPLDDSDEAIVADDINLVESQLRQKDIKKIPRVWRIFAIIIDRTLFVILGFVYLFMILDLLPESFLDEKTAKSVEIVAL